MDSDKKRIRSIAQTFFSTELSMINLNSFTVLDTLQKKTHKMILVLNDAKLVNNL